MDRRHSHISDRLGYAVLAALSCLSALSFLGWSLVSRDLPSTVAAENHAAALSLRLEEALSARDALARERDELAERLDQASPGVSPPQAPGPGPDPPAARPEAASAPHPGPAEALARLDAEIEKAAAERKKVQAELAAAQAEADAWKERAEAASAQAASWKSQAEEAGRAIIQADESRASAAAPVPDPHSPENTAIPGNAELKALRRRVVALEQKLDILGNQRNELARALRAARQREPEETP